MSIFITRKMRWRVSLSNVVTRPLVTVNAQALKDEIDEIEPSK